ncbi:uncharacterized protein FYW61_005695 [Anableps anableps]
MSAIKVALQHSPNGGRSKTSKAMSAEVSPDSKCPICLDIFHNMSYLDRCLHKFCFRCILEWSKNKPECPLCKQPFSSIYHSIKSDQDFQKYELKQQVDNSSFGYFEGVRFRYRTTLTGVHRQMRRTSPPPDNGVMFEAPTNLPQQRRDRYIRRMMMRLAAKRRAASEGRAVNNVREQEMINFRRELYRRGVRVRNVRDGGRSRDTSAEFYRRNPACLHRLVPWLKRELMVLYGAHGSLVNIVQHIIMSRITRYDMEDGAIQEELRPFLQGRTEHFLHEFINFAKSPFNMEAYDQHAVYDCPAPSSNEHSSSNSSVIAISEDEENSTEMEFPGNSTTTLSQSLWDDETPGPSYSTTTEPSRPELQSVMDLDSDSSSEEEQQRFGASPPQSRSHNLTDVLHAECTNEDCAFSDGDDCVIVGYVKPTAERTPELVHLSSDSDDSSIEENKEAPLQSQHIRFTSCSPASSHSSDSSKAGQTKRGQTDHRYQSSSKERPSSNTYKNLTARNTDKRFDNREKSMERHKERDHKRKKSNSSRGRKYSSRSPVISQGSFSSHSSSGHFAKTDGIHARRDSDHSYQSYTHYRRERNGSVTHYTQRRSYYYSSRKYPRSKSRSRSRDLPHRRDRRRSRSRTYSSSCSSSPERKSHFDKPGGKRKYKAKHLAEPSKNAQSPSVERDSMSLTKHKKKSKEKRHKKCKERSRKRSRSGSTELVGEQHKHHHKKKKKKHKKKSKKSTSTERKAKSSPNVITIESDNESFANRSITPVRTTENTFDYAVDDQENSTPVDQRREILGLHCAESDVHGEGSSCNVTKPSTFICKKIAVMASSVPVKIGIIGGSGLDDPDILEGRTERYVDTPYGKPSDALILGKIKNVECVLLARHGRQHTIMPSNVNYRANIWALREEGCTHLVVTTACGSLREEIQPGDIVIIDQFIDRTTKRPQTLYDGQPTSPPGVCHIPMAEPFCNKTREVLVEVARSLGIKCHVRGTMLTIEGPRFSSRAESVMFRQWGADVINMTTVPEVVLAKEAGLCYASIAMATDYDCWKEHEEAVCVDNVLKTMKENANKASSILLTAIPQISQMDWTPTMMNLKAMAQSSVMLPKH